MVKLLDPRSWFAPSEARMAEYAQKKIDALTVIMGEQGFADPTRLFGSKPTIAWNPNSLIQRKGYSVIKEMRRDEQVKAALAFKKHAVMASGWRIAVPSGEDEEGEPAKFVRKVIDDMEGSFESSLLEIMTALDFGFSITERIWEKDGKNIVLGALKTRAPDYWGFRVDQYGNLSGIEQQNRALDIDKFVIYSYQKEFSNWYGRTDLEAAYRAWWTKENAYRWMAMLLERLGIPPIFALYNPDDYPGAKSDTLLTILKRLQGATVGVIPRAQKDSLEFWSPELAGQVATVFVPSLERMDQDIARSLLMPGLLGMTSESGQTGSLARSRVHWDVFMLVLTWLRKEMKETVINEQIIYPLVDLNFNIDPAKRPYFEWLEFTEDSVKDLMSTWKDLVGAKVVQPQNQDEDHIRSSMKFPEADVKAQQEWADASIEKAKARAEAMPNPFGGNTPPKPGGSPAPAPIVKKQAIDDEQFERLLEFCVADDSFNFWEEAKHPRHEKGSHEGGKFAPKGGGSESDIAPGFYSKPPNWDQMTPEEQAAWKKDASAKAKANRDKKKGDVTKKPEDVPKKPGDSTASTGDKHAPLRAAQEYFDTPGNETNYEGAARKVYYSLKDLEKGQKAQPEPVTHNMGKAEMMHQVGLEHARLAYPSTISGREAAAKYIAAWASLPPELSFASGNVVISSGPSTKDAYLSKLYKTNFQSAATGGDGHIVVYNNGGSHNTPAVREVLAHEMGHNLATKIYGGTQIVPKPYHEAYALAKAGDKSWKPSDYAMTNIGEFFAESLATTVASRHPQYNAPVNIQKMAKATLREARAKLLKGATTS